MNKDSIKKGTKVSVEGRFIPESETDNVRNNDLEFGFPQISLDGEITEVDEINEIVYVKFKVWKDEIKIPIKDLLFRKSKFNYGM